MQSKFQWMLVHPARSIAQGAGVGLLHPASGTWGTLLGWVLFVFFSQAMETGAWVVFLLITFPIGVWACQVTGKQLGVHDDSSIVFDEIWAIWLVLLFVWGPNVPFWQQALAFGLFRLFDIWKPYPIHIVDEKWSNGLGVMLDDVLAAFYTLLAFSVFKLTYQWAAS
jgi:phosphatidylglycerophosphatase A